MVWGGPETDRDLIVTVLAVLHQWLGSCFVEGKLERRAMASYHLGTLIFQLKLERELSAIEPPEAVKLYCISIRG